ncbi:MAG: hypothetical protein GXP61_08050 [Epsilonproteobacteria bacterium]|nr:hypothetical protein [Campylobacterota bacterium]
MKIALDVKIPLEIQEGGKTKENLEVFYRDFTRKERKDLENIVAKFKKLFEKADKLSKEEVILDKKIELCEKLEEFEKAFKFTERKEALACKTEELECEMEALGGDSFEEDIARKRFNFLVGGKDKEKLRGYAEIKGYSPILSVLDRQKAEFEKKQYGE